MFYGIFVCLYPLPGRTVKRRADARFECGEIDEAGLQGRVPAPGTEPEGASAGAVLQVNEQPGWVVLVWPELCRSPPQSTPDINVWT